MTTDLKGRDFLSTQDWSVAELETLFTLAAELKQAAREEGMTFLRDSALEKVFAGATTLAEINKVTFIQ